MSGVMKIVGLVLLTVMGCVLTTSYEAGSFTSSTRLLGYPVVHIAQSGAQGWIAIGQVNAQGLIALGQNAWGLVTFAQGGVGILFGLGQGMAGLVAIGQVGISLFFAMGQLAFGMQAIGQLGVKSRDYLKEMSAEFSEVLAYRYHATIGLIPAPRQKLTDAPEPELDHAHDFGAWPEALASRMKAASETVELKLEDALLEITGTRLRVTHGGNQHVLEDSGDAVVQLSRSRTPRVGAWFFKLIGRDPHDHRLHVELRMQRSRVRLHAKVAPALTQGLPDLEQSGTPVTSDALLALLGTAHALGLKVAQGMPMTQLETEPVEVRAIVRVFNGLKRLIRIPAVMLYLYPVMLAPKIGFRVFGSPLSDFVTVVFVGIVLVFFALLAMMVGMYPWVQPPSRRFPGYA